MGWLFWLALSSAWGSARIVGGEPAEPGAWPDAGALYFAGQVQCSAVLISPDLVLTAAHCFGGDGFTDRRVLFDSVDHADEGGVWVDIDTGFRHPNSTRTFDVAVYVLAEPAPIEPRPLALDCLVDDYLVDGAVAVVAGFGSTSRDGAEGNSRLHDALVPVVDADCALEGQGCNREVAPNGELIAGGDGVDSCVGDSGGPLYLQTPDGYYLTGITSRAAFAPQEFPCGSGGIYVRVDAIVEWVEEVTGRVVLRPECAGVNRPPQPVAAPIEFRWGTHGTTSIQPRDPNPEDTHTFEVISHGGVGHVEIDHAGMVTYWPWSYALVGPDVVVEVTDQTGLSQRVRIPVVIDPGSPPLMLQPGCQQLPGPVSGWLTGLGLLLMIRRRSDRRGRVA